MSRHHSNNRQLTQEQGVAVASFNQVENFMRRDADRMNHLVERTGECILILSGYIAYRIEMMIDGIDGNSPFVMRLRNRSNQIIRACDDFVSVFEPHIKKGEEYKEAYSFFSEAVTQSLDALFDDLHRDYADPSLALTRRAKLRYHDPYMTDVKERQAAFEDGFCKGFTPVSTTSAPSWSSSRTWATPRPSSTSAQPDRSPSNQWSHERTHPNMCGQP